MSLLWTPISESYLCSYCTTINSIMHNYNLPYFLSAHVKITVDIASLTLVSWVLTPYSHADSRENNSWRAFFFYISYFYFGCEPSWYTWPFDWEPFFSIFAHTSWRRCQNWSSFPSSWEQQLCSAGKLWIHWYVALWRWQRTLAHHSGIPRR